MTFFIGRSGMYIYLYICNIHPLLRCGFPNPSALCPATTRFAFTPAVFWSESIRLTLCVSNQLHKLQAHELCVWRRSERGQSRRSVFSTWSMSDKICRQVPCTCFYALVTSDLHPLSWLGGGRLAFTGRVVAKDDAHLQVTDIIIWRVSERDVRVGRRTLKPTRMLCV